MMAPQSDVQGTKCAQRKTFCPKFRKDTETGDTKIAAIETANKYNLRYPQRQPGTTGITARFARFAKTSPHVTFLRVFQDGGDQI